MSKKRQRESDLDFKDQDAIVGESGFWSKLADDMSKQQKGRDVRTFRIDQLPHLVTTLVSIEDGLPDKKYVEAAYRIRRGLMTIMEKTKKAPNEYVLIEYLDPVEKEVIQFAVESAWGG